MKVYLLTYASEDTNNSFIGGIFESVKGARDQAQTVSAIGGEEGEILEWGGPSDNVIDYSYDGCGTWEIVEYTLEQ